MRISDSQVHQSANRRKIAIKPAGQAKRQTFLRLESAARMVSREVSLLLTSFPFFPRAGLQFDRRRCLAPRRRGAACTLPVCRSPATTTLPPVAARCGAPSVTFRFGLRLETGRAEVRGSTGGVQLSSTFQSIDAEPCFVSRPLLRHRLHCPAPTSVLMRHPIFHLNAKAR